MRVVLDANVFVSFLLTHGSTISRIVEGWQNKEFTLLTTDEIILEIKQVLARLIKAKLIDVRAANALFLRLEKDSGLINSFSQVDRSINRKDNWYLACAKDGGADYLVTGDKKHLLQIKKFENTKIISPREFVNLLEN